MIREGRICLPFTYAAGKSGGTFFAALQEHQNILGSRCSACDRVLAPLRSFCPTCGDAELQMVEVGPGGVLLAWTERPGKGVFGLIKLDGADTAILHRLLGGAVSFSPGTRVRAHFRAASPETPQDCLLGFEAEGTNT